MNDKSLAASIMHSSGVPVAADTSSIKRLSHQHQQQSQPLSRSSHMYDRDGKRLTGMKGAVAQLLHDHRHFSSDEDLHRVQQSIASGLRAAAAAAASSATHAPRGSLLPDMFGVSLSPAPDAPTASPSVSVSVSAAAAKFTHAIGSSASGSVAPGLRWSLVRCRRAGGGAAGLRWARADRLRVEDALMASIAAGRGDALGEESAAHAKRAKGEGMGIKEEEKEEDGESEEEKRIVEAAVLSAPPEETFSVLHGKEAESLNAFFSISLEEYTALGLDDHAFQPNLALNTTNGEEKTSETKVYCFDFTSTTKLLTLYERFGNFVLVADRWPHDLCVSPPELRFPPVEALAERYRLVTEAVMLHRLRVLRDVMKDEHPDASGDAGRVTGSLHRAPNSTAVAAVPSNPLFSLMEKHPVFAARRCRIDYLRSWAKTSGANSSLSNGMKHNNGNPSGHTQGTVSNDDRDKEWEDNSAQLLCMRRSALLKSGTFSMDAPPLWYDAPFEFFRRKRLRSQQREESVANVPYHRAVAALRRVEGQATQLTARLSSLTATSVLPRKPETRRKPTEAEDSYAAVCAEVQRVPMVCERMRLCVQAGMFLQAPVAKSASGAGVHGNHSSGNHTTNNSNAQSATHNNSNNNSSNGGGGNSYGTRGSDVANRAFSNTGEALLLSLPPAVPRLHRAVEQELEKHLWEDHRAMCEDSPDVQEMLCEARVLYTQNVILRRFAARVGALEAALKKLTTDAKAEEERGNEY